MAKLFQDDSILDLIGDGNLSEIEVESEAKDDDVSQPVVPNPRIRDVEEEIVMDDDFQNELNNMDTVGDIIDTVVSGEIGLDIPEGRHCSIFDILT